MGVYAGWNSHYFGRRLQQDEEGTRNVIDARIKGEMYSSEALITQWQKYWAHQLRVFTRGVLMWRWIFAFYSTSNWSRSKSCSFCRRWVRSFLVMMYLSTMHSARYLRRNRAIHIPEELTFWILLIYFWFSFSRPAPFHFLIRYRIVSNRVN